jgi:hypothetical protein
MIELQTSSEQVPVTAPTRPVAWSGCDSFVYWILSLIHSCHSSKWVCDQMNAIQAKYHGIDVQKAVSSVKEQESLSAFAFRWIQEHLTALVQGTEFPCNLEKIQETASSIYLCCMNQLPSRPKSIQDLRENTAAWIQSWRSVLTIEVIKKRVNCLQDYFKQQYPMNFLVNLARTENFWPTCFSKLTQYIFHSRHEIQKRYEGFLHEEEELITTFGV